MAQVAESDTNGDESLSVETAAKSVFESLLSDEPEDREETSQTPPAKKSTPPAKSTDEQEADPEPAKSDKDESPEQEAPDEEQDGQEPPASLDPNLKVKVKIDGKDEEVTLDEALKGYSRTKDYTRKAQEVATHRKALETETVAARQERAALAQNLKLVEEALEEVRPKEPDWEKVRVEHPTEFANLWTQWQQQEKDRAALRDMRVEADKKVAEDNQKAWGERMVVERDKMLEAVPEWKDEKVKSAEAKAMATFAESLGYTQADLAAIDDHRVLRVLRDAMLYRQTQAKKDEAVKRIETVRTTKPTGDTTPRTPVSDKTRAIQRLAKTHRVADAAGVFETMLGDMD